MVTLRKRGRTLETPANPKHGEENPSSKPSENEGVSSGYEQCRDERIKENLQRMQKLGIFDLSNKLKSETRPPKRSFSKTHDKKSPPINPLPPRRSSRLQSVTPVSYTEVHRVKAEKKPIDINNLVRQGPQPEVYTEEHDKLLGICEKSWDLFTDGYGADGKRIYDPINGKTCHQCRQKTMGHRTHCRACNLVQGQFCGDCLYLRYGENVLEAQKNTDWICPVCRGICNCSLCRLKKGWAPTGPLAKTHGNDSYGISCTKFGFTSNHDLHTIAAITSSLSRKVEKPIHEDMVIGLGFKSVAHYLIQTRRSLPSSEDPNPDHLTFAKRSLPFTDEEDSSEQERSQNCSSELEPEGNEDEKLNGEKELTSPVAKRSLPFTEMEGTDEQDKSPLGKENFDGMGVPSSHKQCPTRTVSGNDPTLETAAALGNEPISNSDGLDSAVPENELKLQIKHESQKKPTPTPVRNPDSIAGRLRKRPDRS